MILYNIFKRYFSEKNSLLSASIVDENIKSVSKPKNDEKSFINPIFAGCVAISFCAFGVFLYEILKSGNQHEESNRSNVSKEQVTTRTFNYEIKHEIQKKEQNKATNVLNVHTKQQAKTPENDQKNALAIAQEGGVIDKKQEQYDPQNASATQAVNQEDVQSNNQDTEQALSSQISDHSIMETQNKVTNQSVIDYDQQSGSVIDYDNKDLNQGDIYETYFNELKFVCSYSKNSNPAKRAEHFNTLVQKLTEKDIFQDKDLTKEMIDDAINHAITSGKYSIFQDMTNLCYEGCSINTTIATLLSYVHNGPTAVDDLLAKMHAEDFPIYDKNIINLFFRGVLRYNHEFQFQWFLLAIYGYFNVRLKEDNCNQYDFKDIKSFLNISSYLNEPHGYFIVCYNILMNYITCNQGNPGTFDMHEDSNYLLFIIKHYFYPSDVTFDEHPEDDLMDYYPTYRATLELQTTIIDSIKCCIEDDIDDHQLTQCIFAEQQETYNLEEVKKINKDCSDILCQYATKLSDHIENNYKHISKCNDCVDINKECNCQLKQLLQKYCPIYEAVYRSIKQQYLQVGKYVIDYYKLSHKHISNEIDFLHYAHEKIIDNFIEYEKDFIKFHKEFGVFEKKLIDLIGQEEYDNFIKDSEVGNAVVIYDSIKQLDFSDIFLLDNSEEFGLFNQANKFIKKCKTLRNNNYSTEDDIQFNVYWFRHAIIGLKYNNSNPLDSFVDNIKGVLSAQAREYLAQQHVDKDFCDKLFTDKCVHKIIVDVMKSLLIKSQENQYKDRSYDFYTIVKYFLIYLVKSLEVLDTNLQLGKYYNDNKVMAVVKNEGFHISCCFPYEGNIYEQSFGKFTKQKYTSMKEVPMWKNIYDKNGNKIYSSQGEYILCLALK